MATDISNPELLTLRFKKHKTTILLLVSRQESFTSIKAKLLDAIKSTGITQINRQPLPRKADDVILGVPIDNNDPSQGWIDLEIPDIEDDGGKKAKKTSVLNATPLGAGLKDGMVLAFKFRQESAKDDGMDIDDNEWDVVLPTFDDEEGSQVNGGDKGDTQAEDGDEV
ncbi:MAG: hypothetical protein Q9210_001402 [Variospora velana]